MNKYTYWEYPENIIHYLINNNFNNYNFSAWSDREKDSKGFSLFVKTYIKYLYITTRSGSHDNKYKYYFHLSDEAPQKALRIWNHGSFPELL